MKKPDEQRVIDILRRRFGIKDCADDVESCRLDGSTIILKIDTMVQSTDMHVSMNLKDAARKSVVSCVSDFAAKGVKPRFGLVSLTLPKGITETEINGLASGLSQASKEFGIRMLGGDTNQGTEITISVVLFGTARRVVGRGGAKTGDLVFVTGPFGYTASGMRILGGAKARGAFERSAMRSIMRPSVKLLFGLRAARVFSASIDSSDGLGTCLYQIAGQSRKKIVVDKIPAGPGVTEFARRVGVCLEDLVFYGGEEFEIVFTAPKSSADALARCAKTCRTQLTQIGHIESGSGVFLNTDTISGRLENRGWRHLR